jgi:hypothetical protein
VKFDVDTLPTVPDAPPEAGPDRALDPPLPDRGPPAEPPAAVVEGEAAVVEDVPQAAETPITAHISAAVTIRRPLLFDGNRRSLGRRSGLAMVTGADESGEDAGGGGVAPPAPPELAATDGPGVALDTGRAAEVSWGVVGSNSLMMAILSLRRPHRECQPFL